MKGRSRGEGLCSPGLAPGLQLPAHDVGTGTVVVDEVPFRVGKVGEETGNEVEGIEGLGFIAVVAVPGQLRGGL